MSTQGIRMAVSSRGRRESGRTTAYVALVLMSIVVLLPFYYLVITSFKSFEEAIAEFKWLPATFRFSNYAEVLAIPGFDFPRYFLNTMYIFLMKYIGTMVTCSLVAYGFVRYHFRYKELIFAIFMSVLMLPGELLTIPLYEAFINLGWMDTYRPLFIGTYFATDIFTLFLFRQFFKSVPGSLFEAARIDGAGELRMYARIMLPLSRPVLVTVFLLYFTGTYNDIYGPALYIISEEKYVLAQCIGLIENLYNTGSQDFLTPFHLVAAATVFMILPVIAVFFAGQKYFIEGVSTAGIKG